MLLRIGRELRDARLQRGLSQASVGREAGISRSGVSRIEHGLAVELSLAAATALFSAVGMDLSVRAFPGGQPVRDRAHLAVIERLRQLVAATVGWQFEMPLPILGDQRAWDIGLTLVDGRAAIEVETRPHDLQDLLRRILRKMRDDPSVDRVVLLLPDTRHNRAFVRDNEQTLAAALPGLPGQIRASLAAGQLPETSGLLLL
jgi:transcriptional regulator with XRE-family HTH domain